MGSTSVTLTPSPAVFDSEQLNAKLAKLETLSWPALINELISTKDHRYQLEWKNDVADIGYISEYVAALEQAISRGTSAVTRDEAKEALQLIAAGAAGPDVSHHPWYPNALHLKFVTRADVAVPLRVAADVAANQQFYEQRAHGLHQSSWEQLVEEWRTLQREKKLLVATGVDKTHVEAFAALNDALDRLANATAMRRDELSRDKAEDIVVEFARRKGIGRPPYTLGRTEYEPHYIVAAERLTQLDGHASPSDAVDAFSSAVQEADSLDALLRLLAETPVHVRLLHDHYHPARPTAFGAMTLFGKRGEELVAALTYDGDEDDRAELDAWVKYDTPIEEKYYDGTRGKILYRWHLEAGNAAATKMLAHMAPLALAALDGAQTHAQFGQVLSEYLVTLRNSGRTADKNLDKQLKARVEQRSFELAQAAAAENNKEELERWASYIADPSLGLGVTWHNKTAALAAQKLYDDALQEVENYDQFKQFVVQHFDTHHDDAELQRRLATRATELVQATSDPNELTQWAAGFDDVFGTDSTWDDAVVLLAEDRKLALEAADADANTTHEDRVATTTAPPKPAWPWIVAAIVGLWIVAVVFVFVVVVVTKQRRKRERVGTQSDVFPQAVQ